jgi:4-hydroxy-tetrahydrodipicolinate synthase
MNFKNYALWTAVITPLDEKGVVDFKSFEKNLRLQEKTDVAVVVLGSTGEALNLNDSEKREIVQFAVGLNLKVPMMVGLPGHNMDECKKWISFLETQKVDCYLAVTPIYAKPGAGGQHLWFKEILDSSSRPVMLYNVPSRSGVSLSYEAVTKLKDHKNFWAIKEASGKVEDFKKYKNAAPNAAMYSGDDALMPLFARAQGVGLVSVASNVWPVETKKYVELCLSRELLDDHTHLWEDCANSLFAASNPVPVKILMHKLGMIAASTLRLPLSALDLKDHSFLLTANDRIKQWYAAVTK